MEIFADQCVHTDVVKALRKVGFKLEKAKEKSLDKASDEEIFDYVLKNNKLLLTFDHGYGNIMRFNIKRTAGVVIVYVEKMGKDEIIKKVLNFFLQINPSQLKGKLFIIEPFRQRLWPK